MRYKARNRKGEYTMSGVYAEVKDEMQQEINYSVGKGCHVSVALFTRVMNLYFKYWFLEIINNKVIMKLPQKFGYLFVVQSLCIRYNPVKVYFVTENGEKVRKTQKLRLKNGRYPSMFWDSPKKWRVFKFDFSPKWKKMICENFFDNNYDYEIMDLEGYGKKASPSYIPKLK